MKNIQRILLFAVCLCTAFTVQAQSLTVTGKVIDAEGLEVIGANITLKGASGVGSISDLSGNYRLKALDEVVVVGYGTSKRSDLTGSVVSVKSEDLMKMPTSDVAQALAGRVAGVQITQSEGAPGSEISIRVRGGISITQSNEPLYIIDGFPSEDGMSTLDPAEIETIDILKDASATAIYGARGARKETRTIVKCRSALTAMSV